MVKRTEFTPYFQSACEMLEVEKAQGLRNAQRGAFWAVRAHFTMSDSPVLVVLPTGVGKTALMTLLAIALTKKRLLVVVPSTIIREQVVDEFKTLRTAREAGCVPDNLESPRCFEVRKKLQRQEDWESLAEFDVIVGTPKCLSPVEEGVWENPPATLFDYIFFDEGHHLPASTWQNIMGHFTEARFVTLTATPFRRDRRVIPGEIVYSYSIAKAIQDGIYRPVELIRVRGIGTRENKDEMLAQRAVEVLNSEKYPVKLLVRVGRIKRAKTIQHLYAEKGVHLEIVSSRRSLRANRKSIERVRYDPRCHGVITVGMLGEGLDLPALGVAVMHAPYQSIPATLQFVGRICRMSSDLPIRAKLLVIPEDIQEHTRRLYEVDADWNTLLSGVVDTLTGEEKEERHFLESHGLPEEVVAFPSRTPGFPPSDFKLSLHDLRLPFVATVYRVTEGKFSPDPQRFDLPQYISLISKITGSDVEGYLFQDTESPYWMPNRRLKETRYELVLYYRRDDLLFEFSTSETLAKKVRCSAGRKLEKVSPYDLEQVISQGGVTMYYGLGMRRVVNFPSSVPTYKILTGKGVENAIRSYDSLLFSTGHVFGRVGWQSQLPFSSHFLSLGVSTKNAKVWASASGTLRQYTMWCDQVAQRIKAVPHRFLPFLPLREGRKVPRFPSQPYAAELPPDFLWHVEDGMSIVLTDIKGRHRVLDHLDWWDISVENATEWRRGRVQFVLHVEDMRIPFEFTLREGQPTFKLLPTSWHTCVFYVPDRGQRKPHRLGDYFAMFPPTVYLLDGGAVVGNLYYSYSPPSYKLPAEMILGEDWRVLGCDITVEDIGLVSKERARRLRANGLCDVLRATRKLLPKLLRGDAVAFCDHHAGEIADYVAIERVDERLRISLFHCKASSSPSPGVRMADAFEVLGQVRKSTRWLWRKDLFAIMEKRMNESNLVVGSKENFLALRKDFIPQQCLRTIYAVQPGFHKAKITNQKKGKPMRVLLLSVRDELRSVGVEFRVIGSA